MSPPPELEPRRRSISLAKLATILAVVFCLAFGLCAISVLSPSEESNYKPYLMLTYTSITIEAVCLLGLVAIAILAIIRKIRSN